MDELFVYRDVCFDLSRVACSVQRVLAAFRYSRVDRIYIQIYSVDGTCLYF